MSSPSDSQALSEPEAKALLADLGLAIPNGQLVARADDVQASAPLPAVAKLVARGLSHKSDLGAVRTSLPDLMSVRRAVSDLFELARNRDLVVDGVLVEEHVQHDLELIIGVVRDATYGPAMSVGLGGIWVEALDDRAIRLLPVDAAEARAMLEELKAWPILAGTRGTAAVDIEAIVRAMVAISDLVKQDDRLLEVEVNPLAIGAGGVVVLDALIVKTPPGTVDVPSVPVAGTGAIRDDVGRTGRPRSQETLEPTSSGDAREAVLRMLNPASLAVIGASKSPTAMSSRLRRYVQNHDYPGRVYLVNPRESEIDGQPCYPDVASLPETVDVVHILTPATAVAEAVADAGSRGVPAAVIHASGFAEVGQDGRQLQDEMVRTARKSGIRLIGPNTSGVVRPPSHTFTAFGMALELEHTPAGPTGLITQSGALGGSLISRGWEQGLGFSFWAATGNEADLTVSDVLEAMADDPETGHFLLFLETIRDWDRFHRGVRRALKHGKPVFAYKTGRTDLGRRAVESHTGAMLGDEALADVALRQAGVVRVPELFDLLDIATALKTQPLPRGRRVGVISASGGACSMVADECASHGLEIPPLSPDVLRQISEIVPPFGAPQNPVDVTMQYTAQPEMFTRVLDLVLGSSNIDMLLLALTTNADPPAIAVAESVVNLNNSEKPIVVSRMGAEALAPRGLAVYRDNGVPLFPTAERGVRTLAALAKASEALSPPT